MGPFPILQRFGDMAYLLDLPPNMMVHRVFHVSMLRRCLRDPSQAIPVSDIEIRDDCTYEVRPYAIVDRDTKNTQRRQVDLVKVQWSADPRDATWELIRVIQELYPDLF